MEFTMRVRMDSHAFEMDPTGELTRVLEFVAQAVRDGDTSDVCVDRFGSTVGGWEINE